MSIVVSFCSFLLLFVIVGILSAFKSKKTTEDYLLAGKQVSPWLVSLSAVSTCNSGYMYIGMIGFTYVYGLSSIWLVFGWIFGDFLMSLIVHKRLRVVSDRKNILSFGGAVARWHGEEFKVLRWISGFLTIIFLGTYAAAQFSAGSKALHVLLGWDYSTGAIIACSIVFFYCLAGGIRASIWTDAVQSIVMILAMFLMLFVTVNQLGGLGSYFQGLGQVSDTYLNLFPKDMKVTEDWGKIFFVLAWIFSGFAVIGQPHVMVRFMTMERPEQIGRVRFYYYSWYTVFALASIGVGMSARLLLTDVASFDAELALPMLAKDLLPGVLVGAVLAGLFAASMSTADSQILSSSAALTRDVLNVDTKKRLYAKLGTLVVALVSLAIALSGTTSVYYLAMIGWTVLGATFGPILILYAFGRKMPQTTAVLMVVVGSVVSSVWTFTGFGIFNKSLVPSVFSGYVAGFMVYFLSKWIMRGRGFSISRKV